MRSLPFFTGWSINAGTFKPAWRMSTVICARWCIWCETSELRVLRGSIFAVHINFIQKHSIGPICFYSWFKRWACPVICINNFRDSCRAGESSAGPSICSPALHPSHRAWSWYASKKTSERPGVLTFCWSEASVRALNIFIVAIRSYFQRSRKSWINLYIKIFLPIIIKNYFLFLLKTICPSRV